LSRESASTAKKLTVLYLMRSDSLDHVPGWLAGRCDSLDEASASALLDHRARGRDAIRRSSVD